MHHLKDEKTCQSLKEKYTNLFDLVNHSIKIARNIIETERESKTNSSIKNPSYCALDEIANGVDVIEPKREKLPETDEAKEAGDSQEEEKPKRKILKNLRTIDK